MAQYGMVTDLATTKQELRELNRDYNARRTWEGLETSTALSAQKANASLMRDYSTAMSSAYNAAQANKRIIDTSGILGQQSDILRQENEASLRQAYETYMTNLQQGQQSIAENYNKTITSIDEALAEQAQYTNEYADKHYDYLEYLYYQYLNGENKLFDETKWNKFLIDELDENNKVIGKRLKTRDELYNVNAFNEYEDEKGNKQKEWLGLYDDSGNLTMKGVDFYDQMENEILTGTTFGQFLAQTDINFLQEQYGYTKSEAEKVAKRNAEILEWSQSYNPYNFTETGTNKGTFRTMTGRVSTDDTYSYVERFGGLSREQIDSVFKEYNDAAQSLASKIDGAKDKGKDITGDVSNLVDSIHNLATELGIDNDVDVNWDELKALALKYHSGTKGSGEMAGDWFGAFGKDLITGAGAGTTLGGIMGSVVPGVGTALGLGTGAVVGAIVGAIGGIVEGSMNVDTQRKQNEVLAKQTQELYNNLLVTMTNYALSKKRQAEIDFRLRNS